MIFSEPRLVAIKELADVFAEPKTDANGRPAIENWEEKKFVFFMLLNCSEIEKEKDEILARAEHQVRLDTDELSVPGQVHHSLPENLVILSLYEIQQIVLRP